MIEHPLNRFLLFAPMFIVLSLYLLGCGSNDNNEFLNLGDQIKIGRCIENHFGGNSTIDLGTLSWSYRSGTYPSFDIKKVQVWDRDTIDGPVQMVEYIKNNCIPR